MSPPYVGQYRCSSLPMGLKCAGAVNIPPGETQIDSVSGAADQGNVVHSIAGQIVVDSEFPADWAETCQLYGLTKEQQNDVQFMSYAALDFWKLYSQYFPRPLVEKRLVRSFFSKRGRMVLTGHTDVISFGPSVVILDWKSTRLDLDYTPQMLGYAWLALPKAKGGNITTIVVFLRDRTADVRSWRPKEVKAFFDRFKEEVVEWDGLTYRPGAHCAYCRRFHSCSARHDMIRAVVTGLDLWTAEGRDRDVLALADKVDQYEKAGAIALLCERFREQTRALVIQNGGAILGRDGRRLVAELQTRDSFDSEMVLSELSERYSVAEMASFVTVRKGDLLKLVTRAAPRGHKGEAREAFMQKLRDAGAVSTNESFSIRIRQSENKEVEIGEAE